MSKDIEKEVRKQVDEAIAQAKESPMPDPSELFTDVYVKEPSDAPEKAQGPMEAAKERDSVDEKQRLGVPVLGCCNSSILC